MIVMVLCEGQTEQAFVKNVLGPIMEAKGISFESAMIKTGVDESRGRQFKGGHGHQYAHIRGDLERLLRAPQYEVVTTMLDYYGLPSDFPGLKSPVATHEDCYLKVTEIEAAFERDINRPRFVAGLVLHEFEGLLFADSPHIAAVVAEGRATKKLENIVAEFGGNPELINKRPGKNPAARLKEIYGNYKKPLHGPRIALRIGVDTLRARCRHFDEWLRRVEERAKRAER